MGVLAYPYTLRGDIDVAADVDAWAVFSGVKIFLKASDSIVVLLVVIRVPDKSRAILYILPCAS